jgi:hypothetical protein
MIGIGQSVIVTAELYDHLNHLGVLSHLRYGDELVIGDLHEDGQPLPVMLYDPINPDWTACVSLLLAERAHEFYESQKELERHGEGVYTMLPLAKWYEPYHRLSPAEKRELYRKYTGGDEATIVAISRYLEGKHK